MGIPDPDDDRATYRRNAAPLRADVRRIAKEPASYLGVALVWTLIVLGLFVIADRWVFPRIAARPPPAASVGSADRPSSYASTPGQPLPANRADTPPAASAPQPQPPSDAIYRCGNSYGATPCPNGRAIDGPAATGFDSRPSRRLADLVAAGRVPEEAVPYANGTTTTIVTRPSKGPTCHALANQILGIDADARQPHAAAYLDWLRGQRQAVRDQQSALHC